MSVGAALSTARPPGSPTAGFSTLDRETVVGCRSRVVLDARSETRPPRSFAGRARKLSDPLEIEQARDAYCEPTNAVDYVACMNWRKGRPTRSRVKDLTRGWFEEGIPLVVELDAQTTSTDNTSGVFQ